MIVVFDTDCVLCSGMVAFILAHERDHSLRFASAWSNEGSQLAALHGFSKADLNKTFLVIDNDVVFSHSDAGLQILGRLKAPWRWLAALALAPRPLRDGFYRFIAARRYRWFGRRENCVVVPLDQRDRFIGIRAGGSAMS